ncbi:MAG: hypothetical protein IT385_16145 [Deltaproteobacteria bacterium]|nr:hypothetical protein [Deltaproteobacteria bacterium]
MTIALAACGNGEATAPPEPHPLCERRPDLCPEEAPTSPTQTPMMVVAPSSALPPEVSSQVAHNNLDVAWHDAPDEVEADGRGRLFFAFRTAPNHFASSEVVMWIVSTPDLATWRYEGQVAIHTDVREPQLVSHKGKLLFYFTELGSDMLDFTPRGTRVMEWLGPGHMTEPEPIFEPGFLVWRIKAMARPGEEPGAWLYAFGYDGGENVYEVDGEPIRVRWIRSSDGRAWEPVDAAHPIVLEGGASETDAVFLDDGRLVAVARNEAGDQTGFGSKICRAEADAVGAWTCVHDPRKYDSPLVFRSGDGGSSSDVWLVARRNVTETGHYDLGRDDLPMSQRYVAYQSDYWIKPKRCALWRVDPEALAVSFVMDLPSRGDTCFPEAITLAPGRELVFNYTSPIPADPEAPDIDWITGQTEPTIIYWTVLGLP